METKLFAGSGVAGGADPGDRGFENQGTGISDPGYNRTSAHLKDEAASAKLEGTPS
jgi:hypothetical protein